jgi:8-oxo-dGTP pyrophosphatase MutT (NUDIX family)
MERHLTVSGFVVHDGKVALHWHRKIGAWLPAGGHIEPNEDPVQATLREVHEEFGLDAEIIPLAAARLSYEGGPRQIEPPYAVLDCWPEPDHGHVDLVYFCRVVSGYPGLSHDPENPILWFNADDLERGSASRTTDTTVAFPPDVRALGIEAIRLANAVKSDLHVSQEAGAP